MPKSFAADIRPLFRQFDIDSMKPRGLDLSSYTDVSGQATQVLDRLQDGSMPCDNPWPQNQIDSFQQWITDGKKP